MLLQKIDIFFLLDYVNLILVKWDDIYPRMSEWKYTKMLKKVFWEFALSKYI